MLHCFRILVYALELVLLATALIIMVPLVQRAQEQAGLLPRV